MLITAEGLVIGSREAGDNDLFIDVLTAEYGAVEICVKGAKKITGKNNAAAQLFSYSKFCFSKRGERYYLNSSEPIRNFYGLRLDLQKLSLASYFAEAARYCVTEGQSARDVMSLMLNTLYLLSEGRRSCEFLKSVFELRLLSEIGMMPQLIGCRDCYSYECEEMYFMIDRSCLLCGDDFFRRDFEEGFYHVRISVSVLRAMRHICLADKDRLFNFRLGERSQRQLSEVTERYFLTRLSHGFKTLDYYKKICGDVT